MSTKKLGGAGEMNVSYGYYTSTNGSNNYKAESKALILIGSNRLRLFLCLVLCVCAFAMLFYSLFSFTWLLFGHSILDNEDYVLSNLLYFSSLILSVLLSSPVFHGYKIAVANTVKNGQTDMTDMFVPFSSLRSFFCSLYSGFVSVAPVVMTTVLYCVAFLRQNYTILLLCLPFFCITFFAFRAFRRVARINAFYPDKGFAFAWKVGFLTPAFYKKTHLNVAASFFGQFVLTYLTVFIYGFYNTFAQYDLASMLTVADIQISTVPRKENI